MRIAKWVALPIAAALLVGFAVHAAVESFILGQAERDVRDVLLSHRGVHLYIQRNMHPEFYRAREAGEIPKGYYAPEILSSSFMVRALHGYYNDERKKAGLPPVYYKMAALNPRNPVNAADPAEKRLLEHFRSHPRQKEYRAVEKIDGTTYLVLAMPFLRNGAPCLRCHGQPEDAPEGLRARYADGGGYGEKLGDLRAVESLRVPIERERLATWAVTLAVFAGLGTIAGLFVFSTFLGRAVRARADELSESEERWKFALEGAGDGVWDWNVATDDAFFSERSVELFGGGSADAHGKFHEWESRVHPEDAERRLEALQRHLRGEAPVYESEHRLRGNDGVYRWVVARGKVMERGPDGSPLRLLGTHRDVTEQHAAAEEKEKLQAQLAQAQKLETVGRLAGGVAHDFNNMLCVILGQADLAQLSLGPDDPLQGPLTEIQRAAERSAELTRQLLGFARKQTISPKVLDFNGAVEGTLTMLRRLIGEDIELHWAPGSDVGKVRIDPSQLDQLVANLAVNSRDAIDGAGVITLETGRMVLERTKWPGQPDFLPGPYAVLSFIDNGKGMTREVQDHIFEPFFTTKEPGKGTGLGLATVFGIVRQNGGQLTVYSEVGRGTTLRIYLPCCDEEPSASVWSEQAAPAGGTETILLAEDDEAIRRVAKRILAGAGYTVLAAPGPAEALRTAEEHEGDVQLLLTDVVMPEMNGRELAQKVRELRPGVKFLYMSGYTANVIAHRGVLDEGIHFISKPLGRTQLLRAVRAVLDGKE